MGWNFLSNQVFVTKQKRGKTLYSYPNQRETVRIYFPEKGPAWKLWVQEIQDEYDDRWIFNRFKVTNVKETRSFSYTPEAEGIWSNGSIIPWYVWDESSGLHFFTSLGMGISCISFLYLDETVEIRKAALGNLKNVRRRWDCLMHSK